MCRNIFQENTILSKSNNFDLRGVSGGHIPGYEGLFFNFTKVFG